MIAYNLHISPLLRHQSYAELTCWPCRAQGSCHTPKRHVSRTVLMELLEGSTIRGSSQNILQHLDAGRRFCVLVTDADRRLFDPLQDLLARLVAST